MEPKEFLMSMFKGELELVSKEVKAQKKSGVIYVPMKYIGKNILIIIKNEN